MDLSERVNIDDAMRIICSNEDEPIAECCGNMIEYEQTTKESAGAEDPKEKTVVPPVHVRSYLFSNMEYVPFKSLKDLKADYMEARKQSFDQVFQFIPQAQKIVGSKV